MRVLLYTLFMFLPLANAYACIFPPSLEEKLKQSDVVFSGEVVSTQCEVEGGYSEFVIKKLWKGKTATEYKLNSRTCPKELTVKGGNYLIFAKLDKNGDLYPTIEGCPGSVQSIHSRWKEWFLREYLYLKISRKISWSFSVKGDANDDIEKLGIPKYSFNG